MKKKQPQRKVVKKSKKTVSKSKVLTNKKPVKTSLGTPYGNRILIKPISAESVTTFGLIIPDTAKAKPEQGIVIAVGAGKKNDEGKFIPISVQVGDRIMFTKYGYDEIKINGIEYYLIQEDSITYVF